MLLCGALAIGADRDVRAQPDEAAVDDDAPAAVAAPWTETGEPPPGYGRTDIHDLTVGMRDDHFFSVEVGKDGTIYAGTYQGRVYQSTDQGVTWVESTVLPEVKPLFGFVAQKVLLGALRSDGAIKAEPVDLGGLHGERRNWRLLRGDLGGVVGVDSMPNDATESGSYSVGAGSPTDSESDVRGGGARGYRGGVFPTPYSHDEVQIPTGLSQGAVLGGGGQLGAGLSARAPRLSLLLTIMRRPIANISLQRLLVLTAARSTVIRKVIPHPTDERQLFAATAFGLYQSYDRGVSWVRTFSGLTPAERVISDIVADPEDPRRLYMATSRGLFVSNDAGASWQKNTRVPELYLRKVVVDQSDPRHVYVAGNGGVYRSGDRGENFQFAYYHSLWRRRNVFWMTIDPFDSNTAYLGTGDGLMVTHNLRDSTSQDWEVVNGLRTSLLVISTVAACSRHPGHIYMMTRADLPVINYGANGPESLMMESWDHGKSWRPLAANRTAGDIRWFTLDPRDPDTVWVAFSRAIVRIERNRSADQVEPISEHALTLASPVLPNDPTMGEVVDAALDHHGLSLDLFTAKLDRLRRSKLIPSRFNVTFQYGRRNWGAAQADIRFTTGERFLGVHDRESWRIMAYASWALPDVVHRGTDSAAMLRFREMMMNDEVRNIIMNTVYRNYGELQRLKVRQRTAPPNRDLYTRAVERVRVDYLEAVVDLASGGYLTKWKKKAGR